MSETLSLEESAIYWADRGACAMCCNGEKTLEDRREMHDWLFVKKQWHFVCQMCRDGLLLMFGDPTAPVPQGILHA